MTTMAYRNLVFAIDSRSTRGNVNLTSCARKSFIISAEGFEIEDDGSGGDLPDSVQNEIRSLNGWLFSGDKQESYDEAPSFMNMIGLLIAPHEDSPVIVFEDEQVMVDSFDGEYFALGSGQDFALGAMDAGASAHEAVAVAAQRDQGTGFPINGWQIEDGSWVELEPILSPADMETDDAT